MGLSSKIVWKTAALACLAALAGAVGPIAVAARSFGLAPHPMLRPPIVTGGPRLGVGRGPRAGLRGARGFGYGYGYDGLGLGLGLSAAGLGATDAGFAAPPPGDVGPYPPPLPPPFALPPLPPRCPLIIEVGRGLAHKATTRVVAGRPFCRR